ncbi:hypothetical protein B296_00021922 [Ensete ventricosum]|uniref:Uncharacterized protein n=1 Tax=Ensete ventricosum TaxID=4639 RepID=A0A426ZN14_ENSVE|nr:hypothetical protein B296_00021922 [Ensete ventricosum]
MIFPTLRVEHYKKGTSDAQLCENLGFLEEKCTEAHLRKLTYKKTIVRLYNYKICPRQVTMGDLVLRRAEVSDPAQTQGKLAPTWESLYRVVRMIQEGTYILANLDDKQLSRTWHMSNLRKFYT